MKYLAGIFVLTALAAIACDDTPASHIFAGRLYEETRGCLDTVSSMDIVDGPQPSAPCDPRCYVSPPSDDGGLQVYVSTMCAPYPPAFDNAGTDPRCPKALSLYTANTTCLDDGGVGTPPN